MNRCVVSAEGNCQYCPAWNRCLSAPRGEISTQQRNKNATKTSLSRRTEGHPVSAARIGGLGVVMACTYVYTDVCTVRHAVGEAETGWVQLTVESVLVAAHAYGTRCLSHRRCAAVSGGNPLPSGNRLAALAPPAPTPHPLQISLAPACHSQLVERVRLLLRGRGEMRRVWENQKAPGLGAWVPERRHIGALHVRYAAEKGIAWPVACSPWTAGRVFCGPPLSAVPGWR
jgi:hypothetical protein